MENSKKIEDYKIVHESSPTKLEKEVKQLIEKDYQPYGEMKFSPQNVDFTKGFYQPMVKYSKV